MVRQEDLSAGLAESLCDELSIHSHNRELLRLLESAMRFLTASSLAPKDGSLLGATKKPLGQDTFPGATMSLGKLVIDAIGARADSWERCSTPTLRHAYVNISHLAHVHALVEKALGVEAFCRVDVKYKKSFDEDDKAFVRRRVIGVAQLDWRALIPLLAAVLNDNLSDNVSIRGDGSLKLDLCLFIDDVFDGVCGFSDFFPEEIRIEQCFSLYEFLRKHHYSYPANL